MAKKKLLADKLRTPRTAKKPLDLASVELVGNNKLREEEVLEKESEATRVETKTKTPTKKTKTKTEPEVPKEQEMHRTSFNFPFEVYEAMRIHTFMKRTTMTDYLIGLIKKDLKIK